MDHFLLPANIRADSHHTRFRFRWQVALAVCTTFTCHLVGESQCWSNLITCDLCSTGNFSVLILYCMLRYTLTTITFHFKNHLSVFLRGVGRGSFLGNVAHGNRPISGALSASVKVHGPQSCGIKYQQDNSTDLGWMFPESRPNVQNDKRHALIIISCDILEDPSTRHKNVPGRYFSSCP